MYTPEHEAAWKRIVDFVHAETDAKICCQLGHSGAKGSTQLGWEEMDAPLQSGNWPLLSPSAIAWSPRNQRPSDGSRRHGPRARSVRRRRPDGRSRRLRHARTPLRARLPAVLLHHAADQSPHRSNMAARWRTACAIRWRFSARCARFGRPRSRFRCAFPRTTGSATKASSRTMRSRSRACCRRPASTFATSPPARPRSRRSRSTAACSRRRSPIASATRPAWRQWRSATSTSPTTSTRS